MKRPILSLLFGAALSSTAATAQISKAAPNKNAGAMAAMQDLNYTTTQQKVVLKSVYTKHEIVPVQFATVTEQILVSTEHREGATTRIVTEQILVKEASKKLEIVAAMWQNTTKTIVTKEACKGKPQETKTYIEQVLTRPETVREIEVPAEYRTVSKKITQMEGKGPVVAAEYQTVSKQVVQSPEQIREIEMPIEYQTFEIKKCK
jgi:hypothetical protein